MRYDKIAPGLMVALEDFERVGRPAVRAHARLLGVVGADESPRPPRAVVFVRCDEKANLHHLREHGIQVNQERGRIRTALLPLQQLGRLSEEEAIDRIAPSHRLRYLLDVAPASCRIREFRASSRLDGSGVVVGIVDSGIDARHSGFANRIHRIWDQTLTGSGVPEAEYGVELTGNLLSVSADTVGHGTHVAGIAAGEDAAFSGVAPRSRLVVVKTDLDAGHIHDALLYIFRIAGELGLPAVVNLSLGGHFDAHDGSDDLSIALDDMSGPGRIVCCAAGNEGDEDIHAQIRIQEGETVRLGVRVPSSAGADAPRQVILNGWYSGHDLFDVALRSPQGFQTPFQRVIESGNPAQDFLLPEGRVRITTDPPSLQNGDHQFLVRIFGPDGFGSPLTPGVWSLLLRGRQVEHGRTDVWVLDDSDRVNVVFTAGSATPGFKIGSPGCSASAVTVGSYTCKVSWRDIDGVEREVGQTLDDASSFSSDGPLRTEARKPDLTAPGAWIASCASGHASYERALRISDRYVAMQGTSMATPVVTGLIALLLQRNPGLDPNAVKEILRRSCQVPGQPSGSFHPNWGHGRINAETLDLSDL